MNLEQTEPFKSLDDSTKLWIFISKDSLSEAQSQCISNELSDMLATWKSHGARVEAAFLILYQKFILITGALPNEGISGCGIDSMVRSIKAIAAQAQVELSDHHNIFFKQHGKVVETSKDSFRELVAKGEVNDNTAVFHTAVQTLGDLRQGRFELAFKDSWHAKRFSS